MSDLTDATGPEGPQGIVYTIKGGAGFDAPWLVVRGASAAEVAAQVGELTGLNPAEYEDVLSFLVAADVHIKAVIAATGIGVPAKKEYGPKAGGRPASSGFPAKAAASAPAAEQSAPAADEEPKHEFQAALDLIASATSQQEINGIYVKHKAAFKHADVLKAAEDRVNELKAK